MEKSEIKYDAFISYRHLPLDKTVAEKLQLLLEAFKAPKGITSEDNRRIKRVFRDQSELPLSGDLGGDIRFALENSKYLILVCSSETAKSRYCMEEVRYFKELHGGKTNNILTVLVEGEPSDVLPEELRYEMRGRVAENAGTELIRHEIEPLCADVRADSISRSVKKLKTEFLRIAAGILGCGYDELYRRHLRRKRMRIALAFTVATALSVSVSITVGSFMSAANNANAERYYQQGIDSIENGEDTHLGMMYFAESLELNSKNKLPQTAKLALLLQDHSWGFITCEQKGRIIDGVVTVSASERQDYDSDDVFVVSESVDLDSVVSVDKRNSLILIDTLSGYTVSDANGLMIDNINITAYYQKPAADHSAWIFAYSDGFYIYDIAHRTLRNIASPAEIHPYCLKSDAYADIEVHSGTDEVIISYGGYVHFYRLENEAYTEYKTLDMHMFFENTHNQETWIYPVSGLYVDLEGKLLAVANGRTVCLINLRTKEKLCEIAQYQYLLSGVSFSGDSRYMAISYGAEKPNIGDRAGGFFAVYDISGKQIMSSEALYDEAVANVKFNEDSTALLSYSFDKTVRLWEISDGAGKEMINPVTLTSMVVDAAFGDDDYVFAVQDASGTIADYALITPRDGLMMSAHDDRYPILLTTQTDENKLGVLTNVSLFYFDAERKEILSKHTRGSAEYSAFRDEYSVHIQKQNILDIIPDAFTIEDGNSVACDAMSIHLQDNNGNVLHSQDIGVIREGAEITESAISLDRNHVYIACANKSFIASYKIDYENSALSFAWLVDMPGNSPDGIWVVNKESIVVSTVDNVLLIYNIDNIDKVPVELSLLTVGAIKELRISDDNRFLAASVQKRDTASTKMDIMPCGVLEVWDIAANLPITSVTDNKSYLNGLSFDGEYLYYGLDEELYRKWLPSRDINHERLDFFLELSGYSLDKNLAPYRTGQRITGETLTRVANDDFFRLYDVITALGADEKESLSNVLYTNLRAELMLAGDAQALDGYINTDADISSGKLSADLSDLCFFYSDYLSILRRMNRNADMRDIMSRFVTNIEKEYLSRDIYWLSSYENAELLMLPGYYLRMLNLTNVCDDIVADALDRLAQYYESYDPASNSMADIFDIETNFQNYRFGAVNARYHALLLRKEPEQALLLMLDYLDLEEDTSYSLTMLPELALLLGDAETAAANADDKYETLRETHLSTVVDKYIVYEVSEELDWLCILTQRGILSEDIIIKYLETREIQSYIQIARVSEKARKEGFLEGDILVSVNNERIFSDAQLSLIISGSAGKKVTIEILRNSDTIIIESLKEENRIGIGTKVIVRQFH